MARKNNETTYLIPKRLLKKSTIFTGIGGKELIIISLGLGIGILLFLIFARLNFFIRIFLLIIPFGGAYLLVMPLSYSENAIILFKRWRNFATNTQLYFYSRNRTNGYEEE